MLRKLSFLTSFLLVLTLVGSGVAFGETVEIRISSGGDDAEQHLGDSRMDIGSSDLELPYEDGGSPATDEQVVGLRFVGIPVEAGMVVMDAYVELEVDKTDKEGSDAPVNVIIEGQLLLMRLPLQTNPIISQTGRRPPQRSCGLCLRSLSRTPNSRVLMCLPLSRKLLTRTAGSAEAPSS